MRSAMISIEEKYSKAYVWKHGTKSTHKQATLKKKSAFRRWFKSEEALEASEDGTGFWKEIIIIFCFQSNAWRIG